MPKQVPPTRLDDMRAVATSRGGRLISTDWLGANARHSWECGNGHRWEATWSSIYTNKTWCPFCAGTRVNSSHRLAAMQKMAASRDGLLLSTEWVSSDHRYEWQCKDGHLWMALWSSISTNGTWCPTCAGNTPRSIDELSDKVRKRGGVLLTTTYSGSDSTYDFECNLGHRFSNSFRRVLDRGQWCPTCTKGRISEELARTAFEQIFGEPFPKRRPK